MSRDSPISDSLGKRRPTRSLVHERERYHGNGVHRDARPAARLGRPEPLRARGALDAAENCRATH